MHNRNNEQWAGKVILQSLLINNLKSIRHQRKIKDGCTLA